MLYQDLCSGLPLGTGVAGAIVSAVTLITASAAVGARARATSAFVALSACLALAVVCTLAAGTASTSALTLAASHACNRSALLE